MNQQEKLKIAKEKCLARIDLSSFDQVDHFKFVKLEEVEGEEVWVEIQFIAKKKYDLDNELDEFKLKKKLKEEKIERKADKQKKKKK